MCCLFTCCGWVVDLIQRIWLFAMSCCIACAVCCAIFTTSMSGVALGYNYSLAEFMDLKETNVSVFLKRGVFDDEPEELDLRRSGGRDTVPIGGDTDDMISKDDIVGPNEMPPVSSARRNLDDTLFMSDEKHKYDGQLLRLGAQSLVPPDPTTTYTTMNPYRIITESTIKLPELLLGENNNLFEMVTPVSSLNKMKAIQAEINMRKAMAARDPKVAYMTTYSGSNVDPMRRMMEENHFDQDNLRRTFNRDRNLPDTPEFKDPSINPARFAVPDKTINSRLKWLNKEAIDKVKSAMSLPPDLPHDYPRPITIDRGIVRPTPQSTAKRVMTMPLPAPTVGVKFVEEEQSLFGSDIKKFQDEMSDKDTKDKVDLKMGDDDIKEIDYYEDDMKGLPMKRRRRGISLNDMFLQHKPEESTDKKVESTIVAHRSSNFVNKLLSLSKAPNTFGDERVILNLFKTKILM